MKTLPSWTKTSAFLLFTTFGAAACDDGGQTQSTAGTDTGTGIQQEQDGGYAQDQQNQNNSIPQESGMNDYENRDERLSGDDSQRQGSELYGDTGTGGQSAQGASNQQMLDETENEEMGEDSVAQSN